MAATGPETYQLVSFERPPVEEIAFAVQLVEPVLSLDDMMAIGTALQDEFPVRQLQPPLPRMVQPTAAQSFSISATVGVPLPRFWFVSSDGIQLVQVQEDRIAFNWRRLGTDVVYPRYWTLLKRFESALTSMAGAAPRLRLGSVQTDYCELTYVNELDPPRGTDDGKLLLESALNVAQKLRSPEFLPAPGRGTVGRTVAHTA